MTDSTDPTFLNLKIDSTDSTAAIDDGSTNPSRHIFRLDQATLRRSGRGFPKRGAVTTASGEVRVYELDFEPCLEPFCGCVRLTVHARSATDTLRFHIDLERCDVLPEPASRDSGRASHERARRLVALWDAAVWNDIFQAFYLRREGLLAELDLSTAGATIPFPVGEIETQWWAIGWNEVVPFDHRFAIRAEGLLFVIDDLYCLRARFPVDDVILAFVSAREVEGPDPSREPFMGPVSVARLDPVAETWVREEEQEGAPLNRLMATALELPGLLPTLRRRMKTLRAMYRRHVEALGFRPPALRISVESIDPSNPEAMARLTAEWGVDRAATEGGGE